MERKESSQLICESTNGLKKQYGKFKENWEIVIVGIVAFITMFIFFKFSHPLYVYDTDDWTYIGYVRPIYPTINEWNPTKILPETLLPMVAKMGIIFIKPFVGDYFETLSIAFAICYSMIIAIYIVFLSLLLKKMYMSKMTIIFMPFLILLLHFYIFRNGSYLFWEYTVNDVFNYTIPTLLNAIFVIFFMLYGDRLSDLSMLKKGVIFLWVLLCINSNMYSNVVLMAYIGKELLADMKGVLLQKKRSIKSICQSRMMELTICMIWSITALIEFNGSRAKASTSVNIIKNLYATVGVFVRTLGSFRYGIYIIFLLGTIVYISAFLKRKSEEQSRILYQKLNKCITMTILSIIYLIALSTRVNPNYMGRASITLGWLQGLMLASVYCIGYAANKYPMLKMTFPAILYVLIARTSIQSRYLDIGQYDSRTNKEVSTYILEQVIEADRKGQSRVEVLVPQYESSDNFPIALYGGDRIANTLFNHGMTKQRMNIVLIPSEQVNENYNIR